MEIKIDPEFKSLIPPLSPEEYSGLERNIIENGCRHPIDIWNGFIIDGHNRYRICTEHGIKFRTESIDFGSRADVKLWMIKNQFDRRNLRNFQRVELALALEPILREVAQENQIKAGGDNRPLYHNCGKAVDPIHVDKELSKISKLSHNTISRGKKIAAAATEEQKEQLRAGETSINRVYVEIREKETGCQLESHQILNQSKNNEWYTPSKYIKSVRELLGRIDLDPASCEAANKNVMAANIYTKDDDGFNMDWPGKVFLNPPYGFGKDNISNQNLWSRKLIEQYKKGITKEAILLVNAVPSNKWFQPLWEFPICFTDHRIRFYNDDTEAGQPTHSNCFVYLGNRVNTFYELFSEFGIVAIKYEK